MAHDLEPLDVWFKFENEDDEEPTWEANTYQQKGNYWVEWCHADVGQVEIKYFDSYSEAVLWLESEDFLDFSPGY